MRTLTALTLLLLPFALFASELSSLEERMSAAEFRAAGLDKLSAAELEALNRWLRRQNLLSEQVGTAGPAGAAAPGDRVGFTSGGFGSTEGPISSRIVGPFYGWSGRTEFVLENGQVWRQSEPGTWGTELDSPRVTITQGRVGGWRLSVEGSNRVVNVLRVR